MADVVDETKYWKDGYLRCFISHRDSHKALAHGLAAALQGYGVSSFVAHDTVEPDSEWQKEIVRSLNTMEVVLALISDNFFASPWTNQELGFALGRDLPVISVKIEKAAPQGFVQHKQALKTTAEHLIHDVPKVYALIRKRISADRIRESALRAFLGSTSFDETKERFKRLSDLSDFTKVDVKSLIDGWRDNFQLHECYYLQDRTRFVDFLESISGKKYERHGSLIVAMKPKK